MSDNFLICRVARLSALLVAALQDGFGGAKVNVPNSEAEAFPKMLYLPSFPDRIKQPVRLFRCIFYGWHSDVINNPGEISFFV